MQRVYVMVASYVLIDAAETVSSSYIQLPSLYRYILGGRIIRVQIRNHTNTYNYGAPRDVGKPLTASRRHV